jgi:hypothetical protein
VSAAAHESVKEGVASLRNRIAAYVRERGRRGATCDEVEVALGLRHQTASARISELKQAATLMPVRGRGRRTRSGRYAAVYVVEE